MDAFQLLKTDHRKVAQLFDQLESASGKAKLRVFEQIKTELELHTLIEEKYFYPALEKPKETHDITLEAYEEHDVVKNLLEQLSGATNADDEWDAQAKVLRENVEHHVEEEENELFPKAEDVLSEDEVENLGNRMAAEKQRQQAQPARAAAAKKSRGTKKPAKASKKSSRGAKNTTKSTKKRATKATKKSGSKSASASKSASRSTAAKTARKSRSKKSAAKKR